MEPENVNSCYNLDSGGASAEKEAILRSENPPARSRPPAVPDAAKGSPVLNDLTDLLCTYCTGIVMKCEKVN